MGILNLREPTVPSSVAPQAAARRLPLKRQCVRQFTDTCRVAGSPADSGAVTPLPPLRTSNAGPLVAAQAAARRLPLKRQCVRQFTDRCRVAGSPADSGGGNPPDGDD